MTESFPHLFEPLEIGPVTIPNRIVFGPHGTRLQDGNLPSERHVAYHGARARGGAGLIILEVVHVLPQVPLEAGPYMSVYKEGTVEGWRQIVDEVHGHGAKIFQQVAASGLRYSMLGVRDPDPQVGPSAVPAAPGAEIPREMDEDDIAYLIESFVRTAEKVKAAGFDGIELHAAHGYHLHLWLSPEFNQRTDARGGSVERRCRLPLEVAAAVRAAVGPEMAVGMRVSGADFTPHGITPADSVETAVVLDSAGVLDYLSVSAGVGADFRHVIPPMYAEHGLHIDIAENITKVVSIPTMARGRVTTPAHAEAIIAEGKASMVGMIRALIADPDLPEKARSGRVETIRACVGANDCLARNQSYVPIGCIYNPDAGNEVRIAGYSAPTASRSVIVVGGGPGGCEAARKAAELGHDVTLFERNSSLGGQLLLAQRAPGRAEMGEIVRYYERELTRLGVEVRLNDEVTPDDLRDSGADVVILAVGSHPVPPPVETGQLRATAAGNSLADGFEAGDDIVVYIESGSIQGLAAADYWATAGRRVTIFTPHESPGSALDLGTRQSILDRLGAGDVTIHTGYLLASVDDKTCRFVHVRQDSTLDLQCDDLIYDCGAMPAQDLERRLAEFDTEIRLVGDCATVRGVIGATHDGAEVARSL